MPLICSVLKKIRVTKEAPFVFALPLALYGIAYGSYCLGRSLARLVPVLWARFRKKKKDRP